jgi:hypothetical protein
VALAERDLSMARLARELEDRDKRIRQLESVADRLSERVVARERELRSLRSKLEEVREEADRIRAEREEGLRSLAALAAELDGVRRQARGQATRIRMRALRDAADMAERIAELGRRPQDVRERLLESLEEAIGRLGAEEEEDAIPAESNGFGRRPAAEFFDGRVEVEIGPLSDFSQLVGFEDAAGGIGATSEISVKRFAQGRATLEMQLGEPVELLRELEQRSPFEFRVRDQRADRLVLDVDDE